MRLLLAFCAAGVAAAGGADVRLRPITRREALEPADTSVKVGATSFVQLNEASGTKVDRQGRSCPDKVECGEKANSEPPTWDQACWDCLADYQEFYCEKNSLIPKFVDVCATEGDYKYRGAFCKKFGEVNPPRYYSECFFPDSEYKQIYCEKMKHKGEFVSACATDDDVGPNYCESFAMKMRGFIECHAWPGFMMLYCETKQNATAWDTTCANHDEVGANFCEDFALVGGEIKVDCVKYPSYLKLFCDIKASENTTVETCASSHHTAGMYCQQMALKKNGFQPCFGVNQFGNTYCAEIQWRVPACEALLSR